MATKYTNGKNWKPGDTWRSPIAVSERSKNHKTGDVAATHASQATCPTDCKFLGTIENPGDCYAIKQGMQPFTTRRLNSAREKNPARIAKLEAQAIDNLPGGRKLRVHIVGDCRTIAAAKHVGAAMVRYGTRTGYKAWTYTHAWRKVPASAWQGAEVFASVHSAEEASQARAQGYTGIAYAVPDRHPGKQVYTTLDGQRVVPCPAQFQNGPQCSDCKICQSSESLGARGLAVAFQPDKLGKR